MWITFIILNQDDTVVKGEFYLQTIEEGEKLYDVFAQYQSTMTYAILITLQKAPPSESHMAASDFLYVKDELTHILNSESEHLLRFGIPIFYIAGVGTVFSGEVEKAKNAIAALTIVDFLPQVRKEENDGKLFITGVESRNSIVQWIRQNTYASNDKFFPYEILPLHHIPSRTKFTHHEHRPMILGIMTNNNFTFELLEYRRFILDITEDIISKFKVRYAKVNDKDIFDLDKLHWQSFAAPVIRKAVYYIYDPEKQFEAENPTEVFKMKRFKDLRTLEDFLYLNY